MSRATWFSIPTGLDRLFYRELLESLTPYAAELGLVGIDSATAIHLANVSEHEILSGPTKSWPGTTSDAIQEVHTFRFGSALLLDLFALPIRGWGTDPFPLDLFVLRSDRSPLITTISSHQRAWLQLVPSEQVLWDLDNPAVSERLRNHPPRAGEVIAIRGLVGSKMGEPLDESSLRALSGALPAKLRDRVAKYLREGIEVLPQAGSSRDVLEGEFEVEGGADLLSDGRFCWRRDAAWYVQRYGVMVPIAALKYFESNGWAVPALSEQQIEDIEDFIWNDL